jgi:hypothetical protein
MPSTSRLAETSPLPCTPPESPLDQSVAEAPSVIIATFTPSKPKAPPAVPALPSPAATPRYAAAGMVVTETATPTVELARVSSASMPATPATKATVIVSWLMLVNPPSASDAELRLNPDGIRSSRS